MGRFDGYLAAPSIVCGPCENPYQTPDVCEAYPLVMTTGRRGLLFFHSAGRQQPCLLIQRPATRSWSGIIASGLSKSEGWNDCEDHLGLELEFVAFLAGACHRTALESLVADEAV